MPPDSRPRHQDLWKKFNEGRKQRGQEELTFEEWWKEVYWPMRETYDSQGKVNPKGLQGEAIPEETVAVLWYLGRDKDLDGDVKGDHLARILNYLQKRRTEGLRITLSRLALRLGVDSTHLKRNYLDGLIAEGIIQLSGGDRGQVWSWVGAPTKKGEGENEAQLQT